MSLFEFIENLQKKPESSRKKIAFISVFVITGIIFLIWLTTLDFRFKQRNEEIKIVEKPLGAFKNDIINLYGTIKENIVPFK